MQFFAFLATILLITAGCWSVVGSFVHDVVPGGWTTWLVAWALSVAPIFVLARNLMAGGYPRAVVRLFVFRVFWYAQLLMIVLTLTGFAGFLAGAPFGSAALAGRWVILVMAPALVLLGVGGYIGARRLVTRTVELSPRGMPPQLDGLRIVQLSDLHVGPHTSRRQLARIAQMTSEAAPHILAYTGDQVDDYPRDMEPFARAFGHLTATLGVYAIAGNHDVYAGWSAVRRGLEAMGATVLVNRAVRLQYQGAQFWLAGTGDPAARQFERGGESPAPDIAKTLEHVPSGAFCITLAHNPALFPALAARGVGVTLSGHTHHGQFSLPGRNWSLASLFLEYAMGSYERNGSLLYISPGTNYWGIPFRIGAWPEVTVIVLRAPAPRAG